MIDILAGDGVWANFSVEAAVDANIIQVFVQQVLQPTLRSDDVVVWDSLSALKRPELKVVIESAQVTQLLLPPYSPDFNPIE